jgi:hypothetical protein
MLWGGGARLRRHETVWRSLPLDASPDDTKRGAPAGCREVRRGPQRALPVPSCRSRATAEWLGATCLRSRADGLPVGQYPPPPPSPLFIGIGWLVWVSVDFGSTRPEFAHAAMVSRLPITRSLTNRLPHIAAISPWRSPFPAGRQPGRRRRRFIPVRRRLTRRMRCGGLLASSTRTDHEIWHLLRVAASAPMGAGR